MDEPEEEGWGRPAAERLKVRTAFCRKAAEQLLKRCGLQQPPVPVDQIARKLGFDVRVVDLSIGVDARLRVTGASSIIELASGQPDVRHRFSIGHELGHACLGHATARRRWPSRRRTPSLALCSSRPPGCGATWTGSRQRQRWRTDTR